MSEGTKDQQVEKQRKNEGEDKVRTKVMKRDGGKGRPSERKRKESEISAFATLNHIGRTLYTTVSCVLSHTACALLSRTA